MSDGVPYFAWRDGRPRWNPGPAVRANGFKGQDLKDDQGAWLPLPLALDAARALNLKAGVTVRQRKNDRPRKPARQGISGFVYFLRAGGHIKIGFSVNPMSRGRELSTGISESIVSIAAVRGTLHDEKMLHFVLREHRQSGEWFHAAPPVVALMMKCLKEGCAEAGHSKAMRYTQATDQNKKSHVRRLRRSQGVAKTLRSPIVQDPSLG